MQTFCNCIMAYVPERFAFLLLCLTREDEGPISERERERFRRSLDLEPSSPLSLSCPSPQVSLQY